MRNQRGDIAMILVAILAVILIGGALFYNLRGKTNPDTSVPQQKSSTQEIKKDTDGAALEAEMEDGSKVNIEDAKPSESDMGL